MSSELKSVIERAITDYQIQMPDEQKIFENIQASEQWFLQTFERLKSLVGKALHQVDFKDFLQLFTVLKSDKDIENLLKSQTQVDQLGGAGLNLFNSLTKVRWLIGVKKLLGHLKRELSDIEILLQKCEELKINMNEIKDSQSEASQIIREFKDITDTIREFQVIIAESNEVISELSEKKEILNEYLEKVDKLQKRIEQHKVIAPGGDFDQLSKMRTYIDLTLQYKESLNQNKLPFDKAMKLQQIANEKRIHPDIPILKKLNESVSKFEKFRKDYNLYSNFRRRIKAEQTSQSHIDTKFTVKFINRMIQESQNIDIEVAEEFFKKDEILQDLEDFEKWKIKAIDVVTQLEDSDESYKDKSLKHKFLEVKSEMFNLPIHNKKLYLKLLSHDLLFRIQHMVSLKDQNNAQSIGTWENLIRQFEELAQSFPDIRDNPLYQNLLWEVDKAKEAIDFCATQKNSQKSLASKYNLDKSANYAIFRNKHSKQKLQKMLELARFNKIDLAEEERCLEQWIRDYDHLKKSYEEDTLFKEYQFDKIKEITKQMFLSPLDYGNLYFELKDKIEIAESIKLDLKRIVQEHEAGQMVAKISQNKKKKRLRYSRLSQDLRQFYKECNIKGIKEIDNAIDRVTKSREKLDKTKELLAEMDNISDKDSIEEIRDIFEKVKVSYSQIDIDLESEETDARRQILEWELKLLFEYPQQIKKLQPEEFKDLERNYEALKNHLKNEELQGKFLKTKAQVNEFIRRINKVDEKEDLQKIQQELKEQCPFIDFNQLITDKDAQFLLGKRLKREKSVVEENKMDLSIKPLKKVKKSKESSNSSSSSSNSSSSGDSSDSSSSSSSNSSSQANSDSDADNEEEEEEDSSSSASSNIAQNRKRRNIVPNLKDDFIYENKSIIKPSKPLTDKERKEQEKRDQKQLRKLKKRRRKEIERKERIRLQREKSDREAFKEEQEIEEGKHQGLKKKFKAEQEESQFSLQISGDQVLQSSLQAMKTKLREQSRLRIKEVMESEGCIFNELAKEKLRAIIIQLENEIQSKFPQIDSAYQKKITDIVENVKFLKNYREVAEKIAYNKGIQVNKLLSTHPSFIESVQKVQQKIEQRKQSTQPKKTDHYQDLVQQQIQEERQEKDIEIPQAQSLVAISFSNQNISRENSQQNTIAPSTKPHLFNQQNPIQALIKTIDEESDDLESIGSNPAKFSDEEMMDQTKQNQQNQGMEYDPFSAINQPIWGGQGEYGQIYMPPRNVNYNPYEILEQRSGRFNQKKSQEPIMYDPTKVKARNSRERNHAPPGSLLKVWEGNIEMEKENVFSCQFYSTQDIQNFQILPELPSLLSLKGKARTSDVTNHFLRLRKDKRLIRGWVIRKNPHYQENNDKYTRLFDELESQQKSIIFNIFSGVTLYLIPYTKKNLEFFQQMGVQAEKLHQSENQEFDPFSLENYSQEETHSFAFFSQIKQNFSSKQNFLNPEVLRLQAPSQQESQAKQKDQSFSPITSDEEDTRQAQTQKQLLQSVKTEDTNEDIHSIVKVQEPPEQISVNYPPPQPQPQPQLVQQLQPEESDDDIDIDDLIQKFKSQIYDIQSIQEKLVPIIHKVKGEKEKKLTEFLQELIQSYNNPQHQQMAQIKQESLMGGGAVNAQAVQNPYQQQQQQQQQHRYQGMGQQQQRFGGGQQFGGQYQQFQGQNQVGNQQQFYRPPLQGQQQQLLGNQQQFQKQNPMYGQPNQFRQQYPPQQNFAQNPQGNVPQLRPPPLQGQFSLQQQQFRPGQAPQQFGQKPPYQQQQYPNQK